MSIKNLYTDINEILKQNENKKINKLIRTRLRKDLKVEEYLMTIWKQQFDKEMKEFELRQEINRNEGY